MKVLCIGNATYDITMILDKYPVENIKYNTNEMVMCPGGPSSNAAYLLGKWGIDTSFAGSVGNDYFGSCILDDFRKVNVDVSNVFISDRYKSTTSLIITSLENNSRTIVSYRNPLLKIEKGKMLDDFDYILVDGREIDYATEVLKNKGKAICVMDASRTDSLNIEMAKRVDYLVCSLDFAEKVSDMKLDISDRNSLLSFYEFLEKIFKNKIVITLEDDGCLYKDKGIVKVMPALNIHDVKDTTGAGDVFHGAFLYGLIRGYDYEDVIRLATIASGLSVRVYGGRKGIPELEEVMMIYEKSR